MSTHWGGNGWTSAPGTSASRQGHGRTELAQVAYDQMSQLAYFPNSGATPPSIKLAEKLAQITPGNLSRSFFVNGGSDAVETAVKLARAYHKRNGEAGRYRIISRKRLIPRRARIDHVARRAGCQRATGLHSRLSGDALCPPTEPLQVRIRWPVAIRVRRVVRESHRGPHPVSRARDGCRSRSRTPYPGTPPCPALSTGRDCGKSAPNTGSS